MSAYFVSFILNLFVLISVRSDGEILKSDHFNHNIHQLSNNNFVIYPKCINQTHDNNFTKHDQANASWQETVNTIYSMGACGVWRASASVLGTNAMLYLSGFTSAGISGGSIAAGIQSWFGNVAAGSIFSSLQGLGAIGGVSMFGSMGLGVFIAWTVICGDFVDININFMNTNSTQCVANEKMLYLSLEQAEEIIIWFNQNEQIQSMLHKTKTIHDEYGISEEIMDASDNLKSILLENKNKFMDFVHDTDQKLEIQKKTNNMLSWMTQKGDDIIHSTKQMDEKYEIKKTAQEIWEKGSNKFSEYIGNFFV